MFEEAKPYQLNKKARNHHAPLETHEQVVALQGDVHLTDLAPIWTSLQNRKTCDKLARAKRAEQRRRQQSCSSISSPRAAARSGACLTTWQHLRAAPAANLWPPLVGWFGCLSDRAQPEPSGQSGDFGCERYGPDILGVCYLFGSSSQPNSPPTAVL